MGERVEAILRLFIAIITGILLYIFGYVIGLVNFVHWFYVIITGKRSKSLAEFANSYCNLLYNYTRYMTFTTNERPIPFGPWEEIKSVNFPKKRR